MREMLKEIGEKTKVRIFSDLGSWNETDGSKFIPK